jgi:YVTN family beta-propeller protein
MQAEQEGGTLAELPTGTVTFLFTDIEGSTRLLARLKRRYAELLEEHNRLLRNVFDRYGGQEIDTQGDAFFVVFPRAGDAVQAVVAAQRGLAAHAWPDGADVLVRMGLHTGEPIVGEDRYVGLGIHRAQRICAAGHGGQVLLSEVTRGLVEDDLPDGVALRDLGNARLKDLDRPERLSQLEIEGLPVNFPPLRTGEPAKPFEGRESVLVDATVAAVKQPFYRQRSILAGALAGVIAAAVAIPIFAFAGGSATNSVRVAANSVGAIDVARNTVAHDIPVGVNPRAVAAGRGGVWVTNADGRSVSRIDPRTNAVSQTIPVGSSPSGIALGGAAVWVANALDGTVSEIDPRTSRPVDTIPVGSGPSGVAYGFGAIWVANAGDGTVSKIDPASGRAKTFRVGAGADDIAVGDGSVWVVSSSNDAVYRIDPTTEGLLATIDVGHGPSSVAVGPHAVWVANSLDDNVMRIDPASNTLAGVTPVGEGPSGVAVGAGAVWVASEFAGTVSRLRLTDGRLTKKIAVGNRPEGLAVAHGTLYLAVRAGAGAHRGGTLRYLLPPEAGSDLRLLADPSVNYDNYLTGEAYDGLVGFRRVGGAAGAQIVPDLATGMPSVSGDAKTYTFQLRRGIRYSNGRALKPEDFRYGLERAFKLRSGYAAFFVRLVGGAECAQRPETCSLVKGVVTDEASSSVTFHLVAPDPEFLDKLASSVAIPVPVGWSLDGSGRHVPPTTGPTMLASATSRELVFVRNPYFHEWTTAARPDRYTDRETFTVAKSVAAALDAVEHDRADVADAFDISSVPRSALRTLRTRYGSQAHFAPVARTVYLTLHTKVAPFDDVRVRHALNYAIDRGKVVSLWGGPDTAAPTCQVLPPNFPGYRRYCPYTLSLTKARNLVAASGTKGMSIVFWARPAAFPGGRLIAEYVASVLRSLDYRVQIRFIPPNAPAYLGWSHRRQVALNLQDWTADYPIASNFINNLLSCGAIRFSAAAPTFNLSEFCDRPIDREIKQALSLEERDPSAADALWAKIDHQVVARAPWVPLLNPRAFDFVSRRVGNYQFNPQWHGLNDQMWVR